MTRLAPIVATLLLLLPARGVAQSADPAAALAKLPPLAGLSWKTDARFDPVLLVAPPTLDTTHGFPARCAAWAGALVRLFARDIAGPAGREPPAGWKLVVAVLPGDELYANCLEASGVHDVRDHFCFWSPQAGAVLIADRVASDDAAAIAASMRPLLHAATHALFAANAAPGSSPPLWVVEGLAERLSANTGFEPVTPGALRAPDDEALQTLLSDFHDDARRPACIRPVAELVTLGNADDLAARLARMTVNPVFALRGVANESNLLLAWLDAPDGGAPKDLAAHVLTGALTAKAGTALIADADAAALDAPFVAWIRNTLKTRLPKEDATGLTLAPPAASAGELKAGIAAHSEDLRPPPNDPSLGHAQALRLAMDGDLDGALARLDALIAAPGAMPADEAHGLPLERRTLAELIDLRHRWLATRVGKPLDLLEGDKTVHWVLAELRGKLLELKDPRGTASEKPESVFTPTLFALQLQGSGLQPTAADDEARALCWVLSADGAWKDKTAPLVHAEVGPAGAVVLDLRSKLDGLVRLGRATDALTALAARPLPLLGATETDRDAWLAGARELFADADVSIVAQRLPPLRALSEQVLGARFDADPLKTLSFKGKVTVPAADRVSGSWDFSTAPMWSDWTSVMPDVAQPRKPLEAEKPAASCGVEDHWLLLRGEAQWRCTLGLQAPLSVEWEMQFRYTPDEAERARHGQSIGNQKATDHIELRVCGNGKGINLACRDFGSLVRNDPNATRVRWGDSSLAGMTLEKTYHMRLQYDGTNAQALVDGKQVATLEVSGLRGGGYLEIWTDTSRPIAIRRLVAEGNRDAGTLSQTRTAWIAGQMATLAKGK